jgi:hypothetical protein
VEVGTVPDAARPHADSRGAAQPPGAVAEPQPREPQAREEKPREEKRSEATVLADETAAAASEARPSRRQAPPQQSAAALGNATRPVVAPARSDAARAGLASGRSGAASAASPPTASSSSKTSDEAGSFGAIGLPAGTQYFAKAFARALPVVLGDAAWLGVPLGAAGEASLDVSIDEAGRIADVNLDQRVKTPQILKQAIDRVFVLLNSGTFSLDGTRIRMGVERLDLSVALSQRAPNPDENADPKLMNEKGHQPPTRERPGSAHLTFNSGRRVDVVIRMRDPAGG